MSENRFFIAHPYPVFVPDHCKRLVIGTLPPPRFSIGALQPRDVDFCYGSRDSLFWQLLSRIYEVGLLFDNSNEAVRQRKQLLRDKRIGIADIVASCYRKKMDASDSTMEDVILRDLIGLLKTEKTISQLLFMGGSCKNGPEYFFRRQLNTYDKQLKLISKSSPKVHYCELFNRRITTVSLISPSPAANRAIGSTRLYKERKRNTPQYSPFDFRLEQYHRAFLTDDFLD